MITLLNMPFGSVTWPSLSLALMKSQLDNAGVECRVMNPNFVMAKMMGFGQYETIARFKGHETQVSEWLFADACWRKRFGPDEDEFLKLCGEELGNIPKVDDVSAFLRRVRHDIVPEFLERTYEDVVRDGVPKVVGFSCMFFQTIASLALGRMLKERHPEITLVYGGACFHEEMGQELFRGTPWIDVVSIGEADQVIVPLFQALDRGELPRDLPGIMARDASGTVFAGPPPVSTSGAELDALPDPNFDSFFAAANDVGLGNSPAWLDRVTCPYEASRGCWWGQKSHCTFCGLNGQGMGYREKSPERTLSTMRNLAAKYPVSRLDATDNILSMKYFKTLVPNLIENPIVGNAASNKAGKPIKLFFEVKANLSRTHIQQLNAAHIVEVQPGIESLSSGILDAFDKGVTALQNVYFLKLCREYNVIPGWNILIRVPGEQASDYEAMEKLIPQIMHFLPPSGGAPRIECHRFSPYFSKKGVFAENVRAASWYGGLFPADRYDLNKVAYYFDVTWKNTLGDPAYDKVLELVAQWRNTWIAGTPPRLDLKEAADGTIELEDTRKGDLVTWKLTPRQSEIYRLVADPSFPNQIAESMPGVSEDEIRTELEDLVRKGLVFPEKLRFVALAVAPPTALKKVDHAGKTHMSRIANQAPTHSKIRLPVV